MPTFDMADVKPTVISWVIVGLMAASFIVIAKWLSQKYKVPGLSELMMSV